MVTTDIEIYEDNAGNLYLHPATSDWVYQTDPENSIVDDCHGLAENEPYARSHWSEEWVHGYAELLPLLHHPETHVIADWHSNMSLTLAHEPGNAGRTYLHLPNPH